MYVGSWELSSRSAYTDWKKVLCVRKYITYSIQQLSGWWLINRKSCDYLIVTLSVEGFFKPKLYVQKFQFSGIPKWPRSLLSFSQGYAAEKIVRIHWVHTNHLDAFLSLMWEGNDRPSGAMPLTLSFNTEHFILISITLQVSFVLPNNFSVFFICFFAFCCCFVLAMQSRENGPKKMSHSGAYPCLLAGSDLKLASFCMYGKVGKKDTRQSCG